MNLCYNIIDTDKKRDIMTAAVNKLTIYRTFQDYCLESSMGKKIIKCDKKTYNKKYFTISYIHSFKNRFLRIDECISEIKKINDIDLHEGNILEFNMVSSDKLDTAIHLFVHRIDKSSIEFEDIDFKDVDDDRESEKKNVSLSIIPKVYNKFKNLETGTVIQVHEIDNLFNKLTDSDGLMISSMQIYRMKESNKIKKYPDHLVSSEKDIYNIIYTILEEIIENEKYGIKLQLSEFGWINKHYIFTLPNGYMLVFWLSDFTETLDTFFFTFKEIGIINDLPEKEESENEGK